MYKTAVANLIGAIYLIVTGWTNWLEMPHWAANFVLVVGGMGIVTAIVIFEEARNVVR